MQRRSPGAHPYWCHGVIVASCWAVQLSLAPPQGTQDSESGVSPPQDTIPRNGSIQGRQHLRNGSIVLGGTMTLTPAWHSANLSVWHTRTLMLPPPPDHGQGQGQCQGLQHSRKRLWVTARSQLSPSLWRSQKTPSHAQPPPMSVY